MRRPPIDYTLARALRALADEEAATDAPAHLEAAVLARWDAVHAPRPRVRRVVSGAATLAAGVSLFGMMLMQREKEQARVDLPTHPTLPVARMTTLPAALPAEAMETARLEPHAKPEQQRSTLVLAGAPLAAGEIVHIVRMRMDRSSLAALGITGPSSADVVDVDVLVGEDGVARGLRVAL